MVPGAAAHHQTIKSNGLRMARTSSLVFGPSKSWCGLDRVWLRAFSSLPAPFARMRWVFLNSRPITRPRALHSPADGTSTRPTRVLKGCRDEDSQAGQVTCCMIGRVVQQSPLCSFHNTMQQTIAQYRGERIIDTREKTAGSKYKACVPGCWRLTTLVKFLMDQISFRTKDPPPDRVSGQTTLFYARSETAFTAAAATKLPV